MKTVPCHCCQGSGQEIDQIHLGAEFRRLRKEKNVSMNEMARRMKISAPYLSDLERGKRNWTQSLVERFTENLA